MFTLRSPTNFYFFLLFLFFRQILGNDQNGPSSTTIPSISGLNYTDVAAVFNKEELNDTVGADVDTTDTVRLNDAQNVVSTTPVISSSISSNSTQNSLPPDYVRYCPSGLSCKKLGGECIDCDFNDSCVYGKNVSVSCWPKSQIDCLGATNFTRSFDCRYCYQIPHWLHICTNTSGPSCKMFGTAPSPRTFYQANCTVKEHVICLGQRRFFKMLPCNWTSGKRWSVAMALSITLGGFGVDRFYLGQWREGIGKLFSFGGLGVWTLIDVVLVATGYVSPADGSLYIF